MKQWKKMTAAVSAAVLAGTAFPAALPVQTAVGYGTGETVVEYLDRGICAVNTGSGMLVSWRFLASDIDNTTFNLYRGSELIYESAPGKPTCYFDQGASAAAVYKVETVVNNKVVSSDTCQMTSGSSYFDIPLDIPQGGTTPAGEAYSYAANDCSFGDIDGDGVYEIFLKWDPSNAHDNSQAGYTGNVLIDCYRLTGEKLWRIDLGKNIRAGAHYTQFLVADFDGDGKCEMTCKTADGSRDAAGNVIGDGSKDWRNQDGYILSGPEYYSLFDGETGKVLDTVEYAFPRVDVSKWGDKYGNRVDRFLGTVAYLDGVHPSAVSIRGYYTRMTAVAYDVKDKKLVKRWGYDSGWDQQNGTGWGNGNHNCMPADADGDGRDEIFVGAVALDDDGRVFWCTNLGHGDAMHLSDLDPSRPGQELWVCHEHEPWGVSLIDAGTGKILWHENRDKDTGRCCAGNVFAGNPGSEYWGSRSTKVIDSKGNAVSMSTPAMNFLIWWDGDLERELLDGNSITKVNSSGKIDTLLTADGCESCNGTKATPNLSADLFGDWREELVLHTADSKYLRILCTPYETKTRLTTLMHDPQYRMQAASEQNCYNQPPHPSFYLGSDQPLPDRPEVTINGEQSGPSGPAVMDTEKWYRLRNVKTGEYLTWKGNAAWTAEPDLNQTQFWHFSEGSIPDGYVLSASDGHNLLGEAAPGDNDSVQLMRKNGGYQIALPDTDFGRSLMPGGNHSIRFADSDGSKEQLWALEAVDYHAGRDANYFYDINADGAIDARDISALKMVKLNPEAAAKRGYRNQSDKDLEDVLWSLRRIMLRKDSVDSWVDFPIYYQAEDDAGWYNGVLEDTNPGAGTYLNLANTQDSFAEFRIYSYTGNLYSDSAFFAIRYANGGNAARPMKLVDADGAEICSFQCKQTSGWSDWTTEEIQVGNPALLEGGFRTLRLIPLSDDGAPNLDYLSVWAQFPVPVPAAG